MFKKAVLNLTFTLVIIFFTGVAAMAQNGLGDPIINLNFGAGGSTYGPEMPGIIGGSSPYTFRSSGVPPEGSYIIVNNTNVAPNSWWPTTDNTPGDGNNGYMLIAKTRASGFQVLVEHQINNLCVGTEYEFGAFVADIARNPGGTAPVLRLRVETNTNPRVAIRPDERIDTIAYHASGAKWQHILTGFTTTSSSIVVSIISETPGGPSTDDLAIDDITVNAKGQRIDANFVTAPADFRSTCEDTHQSYPVTATAPENGNYIRWQKKIDGGVWGFISAPSLSPDFTIESESVPGTYRYRAFSAPLANIEKFECSVVSNELTVVIKPLTTASAGPDKFYFRGGSPVMLEGSSNSSDFHWEVQSGADISSLSSTTVLKPLASPNQTTTYVLRATPDNATCGGEVVRTVTVTVADDINMPNVFTPNGDGINDTWVIGGINTYPNPVVQVYNRNGQLIFRSVGVGAAAWDGTYKGKNVPAGNYYYIVDLSTNGIKLSGSVTVIR